MATREAHNKASVEYNRRQDNIMIRPPKEMGAKIREAAAAENMSVQGYILQTLYAKIGITPGGGDKNPESEPLTENVPSCSISPALKLAIKKNFKEAMKNFSENEYHKLREELENLIDENFAEESARKKQPAQSNESTTEDTAQDSKEDKNCIFHGLI